MTDIKGDANPLFPHDEELRQGIELLFFAYRDFTSEPDAILAKFGFGRAHHRVVYFIGRQPGISVSELLTTLRITKQSLSRVLGQLIREGFVAQRTASRDRRLRLLELTAKGLELERLLTENQRARLARAYHETGIDAVAGFHKVMRNLINQPDRQRFPVRGREPQDRR
jgi:DNA-binding MarR family transcriptional regulator